MIKIASKIIVMGLIFLFLIITSFLSLQIEQTFPDTVRTTTDVSKFDVGNVSIGGGSSLDNSLNFWDYAVRMIDVFTFGIFMFKSGIMLTIINIFIFFPVRFIFFWGIMELIRGV